MSANRNYRGRGKGGFHSRNPDYRSHYSVSEFSHYVAINTHQTIHIAAKHALPHAYSSRRAQKKKTRGKEMATGLGSRRAQSCSSWVIHWRKVPRVLLDGESAPSILLLLLLLRLLLLLPQHLESSCLMISLSLSLSLSLSWCGRRGRQSSGYLSDSR